MDGAHDGAARVLLAEQAGDDVAGGCAGAAVAAAAHEDGVAPVRSFPEREVRTHRLRSRRAYLLFADGDLDALDLDGAAFRAGQRLRRFAEELIAKPNG